MHALSRPFQTIRVSIDDLRALVARIAGVAPPDARVRLIRIAGVHAGGKALELGSVNELAALPELPDVLYELSVSVVAVAERPAATTEYRVQLVSDGAGLSLQVFSDDAVWAHGALHVLGDTLAEMAETPPPPRTPSRLQRNTPPVLAGLLGGAAVATAYYHDLRAGGVMFVLGVVLWYVIDLVFAVATPQPQTRLLPNLQVVVRAGAAPITDNGRPRLPLLPFIKFVVTLAAIAAVGAVMLRFFPHQAPLPAPHRASARQEGHR